MSKQRDIEILETKIAEIEQKIINFEKYDISEIKRDKLVSKKVKYEAQLLEIQES